MILVTGGAGFIGSNFVRRFQEDEIIVLDSLTYAGMRENVPEGVALIRGDITNVGTVRHVLRDNKINEVYHFAAETHVDRSIHDPNIFTHTNVLGTNVLLSECKDYWGNSKDVYFHHVSTDEVYGSLSPHDPPSKEEDRYDPRSPYASSKAGADHLVRSYCHTYNFPAVITNCTNNYGVRQSLEKLIPLVIDRALNQLEIPVYGDGKQVRDWLHVDDHISAILALRDRHVNVGDVVGETFNISAGNQKPNIDVIYMICGIIDKLESRPPELSKKALVEHVKDRPAHDRRYALNSQKIRDWTRWMPSVDLFYGLQHTVEWYAGNQEWVEKHKKKSDFSSWDQKNYTNR